MSVFTSVRQTDPQPFIVVELSIRIDGAKVIIRDTIVLHKKLLCWVVDVADGLTVFVAIVNYSCDIFVAVTYYRLNHK